MPGLKTETYGAGDLSWLGSAHGLGNARTEKLDISAFTEGTHYPTGYIKSGTPVSLVSGVLVPYVATEGTTTGNGVLAGFVLTDQSTDGVEDIAVPVIDHGRVRVSKLPITFVAPTAEAKRANTNFVFQA